MAVILTRRLPLTRYVDTKRSSANTRDRRPEPRIHTMTSTERMQGGLICLGAVAATLLFVAGLLRGSYLALAIPVAVIVLFLLGLVFWVGFTIATIRIEAEIDDPLPDSDAERAEAAEAGEPSSPDD